MGYRFADGAEYPKRSGRQIAARYAGFIHCCSVWKRQPDSSMISDWMSFPAAAESWSILWMGARSQP